MVNGVLNGSKASRARLPMTVPDAPPVAEPEHAAGAAAAAAARFGSGSMVWTPGQNLGVGGKGWDASENPGHFWRRLPDRAQAALAHVPYVWDLSMATSGMVVRFSTDAETVMVNVTRIASTGSGGFTTQDDIMVRARFRP